jgi:hypothetical protein
MPEELCACARAMDKSRGHVQRGVTANPNRLHARSQSVSLDTTVHAGLTPVHDPSLAVLGAVRLSIASHALDEGDAKRGACRRLTRTASLHQLILLSTVSTVRVGVVEHKQILIVGAQTLTHSVLMVGSAQLGEAAKRGDTAEVRRLVGRVRTWKGRCTSIMRR